MNSSPYGSNYAWTINISSHLTDAGRDALAAVPLKTFGKLKVFVNNINDMQRIVVGLKGTGKTSALARKASLYAHNAETIPASAPYLCQLERMPLSLNNELKYLYPESSYWSSIWMLVLGTVFCSQYFGKDTVTQKSKSRLDFVMRQRSFSTIYKEQNPSKKNYISDRAFLFFDKLDKLARVGKYASHYHGRRQDNTFVSTVLQAVLSFKLTKSEADTWGTFYVLPEVKDILQCRKSNKPVGIFIDAIDEAFGAVRDVIIDNIPIGYNVWVAIQCGFISAVLQIQLITKNQYRVYGAIRLEAFSQYPLSHTQDSSQIVETCLTMEYTDELLIKIFENNIMNTHSDYLLRNSATDTALDKFFPSREFKYPHAWGHNEKPLEWILRHTFNIPRHIVWHGHNIIKNHPEAKRRSSREDMRSTISATAKAIFQGYKEQVSWDSRVDTALLKLPSNVILREIRYEFDDVEYPKIKPINFLYKRGLIGIPKLVGDSREKKYIQQFLTPGLHQNATLPDASYYILHPCLTSFLLPLINYEQQSGFLNSMFVTGNNLSCPGKINPKIIVHTKQNSSDLSVSYFPKGLTNLEELRSNEISGINLKKACYPFVIALLMSMKKSTDYWVSPQQIAIEIDFLKERHLIDATYGKTPKNSSCPMNAEKYYIEKLTIKTTEDHPGFWNESKKFIQKSFPNSSLKTIQKEDSLGYVISGIDLNDILILL